MKKRIKSFAALGAVAVAAVAGSALWASQAESVPLSEVSHIHGISVDPADPARLYLATHYGVWRTSPDGTAEQVSLKSDDYMGFTPERGGHVLRKRPSRNGRQRRLHRLTRRRGDVGTARAGG